MIRQTQSVPDQGLAECRLCLRSGSPGLIPDDMGDGSYLRDPPPFTVGPTAQPHTPRSGWNLSQWLQAVLPAFGVCVTDALTSLRRWWHLRRYLGGQWPRANLTSFLEPEDSAPHAKFTGKNWGEKRLSALCVCIERILKCF